MGSGRYILEGEDQLVAEWVCDRTGGRLDLTQSPYSAIGCRDRLGNLVGGVVYNNFTRNDCHMHVGGIGQWLTRRMIGECFRYPFIQLGCSRVTGTVSSDNEHALDFDFRLGFQHEGTLRHYFADGRDLILLGMLREECRWLTVGVRRGKSSERPAVTPATIGLAHSGRNSTAVYAGLRRR